MLVLGAVSALGASVNAGELSTADKELRARAIAECNSPRYPGGATPHINYAGNWFRYVEPGSSR